MRKLFAIAVTTALLGVQSGRAELLGLSNFKTDGSIEILGQQANNEVFTDGREDKRGNTITRVRVGATMDVADGVSGRVEVVRNSDPGVTGVQYGDGGTPTTVATEQTLIQIQNAYVDIKDFLYTDMFRVGRQYGGRKGDLILYYGPHENDALSVTAADSLLVSKQIGKVNALGATGKVVEAGGAPGSGTETTSGDVNVSYLILSSDELVPNLRLPLEAGFYQATAAGAATTADNRTVKIYDLRAKYGLMNDALWVSGEYAMNGGQDNNGTLFAEKEKYSGNVYFVKVDYKNEENRFGLKAFMANASGDKQTGTAQDRNKKDKAFHDGGFLGATGSDFHYGEILSNSMTFSNNHTVPGVGLDTGANGRGITVMGLGASYVPMFMDQKLMGTLDYFTAKVNEVGTGGKDGIGTEIDFAVKYRHSDAVTAAVGYATFAPDDGVVSNYAATVNNKTDNVTKLFAKLTIKWGGEPEETEYKAKPAMKAAPAARKR